MDGEEMLIDGVAKHRHRIETEEVSYSKEWEAN
jgi:hypothetical protein